MSAGVRRDRSARPYAALLSARYRMLLQYRAAALAGAVTQVFWGFVRIMILLAFYRSSGTEAPMAFPDVVTYVWLGQALLALLPWNHDADLERQIRDGGVAFELLRPLDLYTFWAMRTLAMRVAATSLRALPIVVLAGVAMPLLGLEAWRLAPPASPLAAALFVLAMSVAIALGCAITMLVHVSLLWTISGDGMARIMPTLVTVFSGMVIPLPLFPDWARPVLELLPFRALVDVPFRIYSGDIPAGEAGLPLALGMAWVLVFVAAGRVLLARGQRMLVVQGG